MRAGIFYPEPEARRVTPLYRLLDFRLGKIGSDLETFVAERRPRLSWEHIVRELHAQTGVYVSWATLPRWFPELAKGSA